MGCAVTETHWGMTIAGNLSTRARIISKDRLPEPITTEGLKYGQRVRVLGISAAPIMRSPEALAVFGPQAFGLADPFVPLEQLSS
jgi:hypothetical protein